MLLALFRKLFELAPAYVQTLLLQTEGSQHNEVLQSPPDGTHVAACAGVGAMIEVTNGTATAAANPRVRTIWRRLNPDIINAGIALSASNRLSAEN